MSETSELTQQLIDEITEKAIRASVVTRTYANSGKLDQLILAAAETILEEDAELRSMIRDAIIRWIATQRPPVDGDDE